ncbi:MAG: cyanophycinase [Candidatus Aminicenantales bacterium]
MKRSLALLLIALSAWSSGARAATVEGRLFIIGGGTRSESMMKRFIALAEQSGRGTILVFPMASATPEETGKSQVEEFVKYGAKNVVFRNLTREDALKPGSADLLDGVGGVYFCGGDQARITKVLLDTPVHARLLDLYAGGAVIGGISAGAAVMSRLMITGDEKREVKSGDEFSTLQAGNIVTTRGLGFISSAIIDQHFATRKRHNRLISLVAENPSLLGVGIDETTAIIVSRGERFEVIGDKDVIVYDATRAKVTITPSKAVGIVGMTTHVLLPGQTYDLKSKKVLVR